MATTNTAESRRELAFRSNNGVEVSLLWSSADDAVAVIVHEDAGMSFELLVTPDLALDAFNHPYAYAASRGLLETEQEWAPLEEIVYGS